MIPPNFPMHVKTFELKSDLHSYGLTFKCDEMEFAVVYLPPTTAKMLAIVLRDQVKRMEKEYGEIKLPLSTWERMEVAPEDW